MSANVGLLISVSVCWMYHTHYNDVIMGTIASQITSLTIKGNIKPVLVYHQSEPSEQLSVKFEVVMLLFKKMHLKMSGKCRSFYLGLSVLNVSYTLQWRNNGRDSVSNHQPHDCLLNCLFQTQMKKTSKLRVTGICVGNSPVTGEFPAQMASNAENASIWWRHHVCQLGPISGRWNGVHQTQFTSKPIYSANKT